MRGESCGIVSDLHCPYHDEAAIEATLSVLQAVQPDTLFFNGDVVDFKSISRFDKAPLDALTLQEDLATTKAVMLQFRQALPETHFLLLKGNHEQRLEKYLHQHPELSVLDCLKLENLLDLAAIDCELVEEGLSLWHSTVLTHGDVVRAQAGQTGQALIQKYGADGVCGHVHRAAQVEHRSYNRRLTWIEGGCLCRLDADYLTVANWGHALTLLEFDGDRVWPRLLPIHEGTCRYDGLTFPTNS